MALSAKTKFHKHTKVQNRRQWNSSYLYASV
uniref:Uncharacterized protein n=1 Tax=Lepeophtheirus salmonis TaxID=72036 RepID=A0A0K2V2B5_LEPSM